MRCLVLSSLPLLACSSGNPPPGSIADGGGPDGGASSDAGTPVSGGSGTVVGAAGGMISVSSGPIAGASVEIPAGALSSPVAITLEPTADLGIGNYEPIGPAVRLGPSGRTFAIPVLLTLPFSISRLPRGRGLEHVAVLHRNATGPLEILPPGDLDVTAGRMKALISRFSDAQASARMPSTTKLTASPSIIDPGQQSTLTWTVGSTVPCTLYLRTADYEDVILRKDLRSNGALVVTPPHTSVYRLSCGPDWVFAEVFVRGKLNPRNEANRVPELMSFSAEPRTILQGERATLSWLTQGGPPENATPCSVSPGLGCPAAGFRSSNLPRAGDEHVCPEKTTTYELLCLWGPLLYATVTVVSAGPDGGPQLADDSELIALEIPPISVQGAIDGGTEDWTVPAGAVGGVNTLQEPPDGGAVPLTPVTVFRVTVPIELLPADAGVGFIGYDPQDAPPPRVFQTHDAGVAEIQATVGSRSTTLRIRVVDAPLQGLRILPERAALPPGIRCLYRADGTFAGADDGGASDWDVTRSVFWASSDPTLVQIAPDGTVTTQAPPMSFSEYLDVPITASRAGLTAEGHIYLIPPGGPSSCEAQQACTAGLVCKDYSCSPCEDEVDNGLCGAGNACVDAHCVGGPADGGPPCTSTSECAGGLVCKGGACFPCIPGVDDSLCGANRVCTGGICIEGADAGVPDGGSLITQLASTETIAMDCPPARVSRKVTLQWQAASATACTIDYGGGNGPEEAMTAGTRTLCVLPTQTFTLACAAPGRSDTRTLTIPDLPSFKILFARVTPNNPQPGTSYALQWAIPSSGSPTCTLDGATVTTPTPGLYTQNRTAPGTPQMITHTIACTSGTGSDSVVVNVQVMSGGLQIAHWGNVVYLLPGEKLLFHYDANTTTLPCAIDHGIDSANPVVVDPPAGTTTYTLTCTIGDRSFSLPWVVHRE